MSNTPIDREHWSRVAREWIEWARLPGHDAFWAYRESLVNFVGSGDGEALDIGCGEGRVSRVMKDLGYRVTASDPVAELVKAAVEVDSAHDYAVADSTALPFTHGGTMFEILAALCPHVLDPLVAPIAIRTDRQRRQAHLHIAQIGEVRIAPIKNPVTGEEHRARIVLPDGFEFTEAEMANAVTIKLQSTPPLVFEHANTYGQLNTFAWSNA